MEPDRDVRGVSGVNHTGLNFAGAWADEPSGEHVLGEIELVTAVLPNFVDFYRDQRASIARAVALTIGELTLANEAVDEAMTRAYARWPKVQCLDNPGGWVYRVALNWSRSALRRLRRPSRVPALGAAPEPTAPEPAIAAALAALSPDHRAVVVCRHLLGWSEDQTAVALGIRPGTVKSRSYRAIQILQSSLAHLNPEAPQ